MKSKEAVKLARIEFEKDLEYDENNQWLKNIIPELEQAEKDLEVMEILKRVDWLVYNNGDKNDFNWYIDTNKSMQITKEEAGRLKGWLNEK